MHTPTSLPEPMAPQPPPDAPAAFENCLKRWRRLLWRNSVAALVATGCDALCYAWGVRWALWEAGLATAFGAVVGGAINYGINRMWTFGSRHNKKMAEMWRYMQVSVLAALCSSGCVSLWAWRAPEASPMVIWVVVKCAVSWGFSLPLQRFYVFGDRAAPRRTP